MKRRIVVRSKRKFAAALTVFLLTVAILTAFTFNIAFADSEAEPSVLREYVVCHGDTLWSIAVQFKAPDCDTRIYIRQLMDVNGLTDPSIMPNQHLLIP